MKLIKTYYNIDSVGQDDLVAFQQLIYCFRIAVWSHNVSINDPKIVRGSTFSNDKGETPLDLALQEGHVGGSS